MATSFPPDPIPRKVLEDRKRKGDQLRGNYDLPKGSLFLDFSSFGEGHAFFGTTSNTPHEIVDFDGQTFFIARMPEGDFVTHSWDPKDTNGYLGAEVTFLLQDGSLKSVKGPYVTHPGFRNIEALAKHLNRPELLLEANKITAVGRVDYADDYKMIDIVDYAEESPTLRPVSERIQEAGRDLTIRVKYRGGRASYSKGSNYLHANMEQRRLRGTL